jgi:hypothetical protein
MARMISAPAIVTVKARVSPVSVRVGGGTQTTYTYILGGVIGSTTDPTQIPAGAEIEKIE